MLRWHASQDIVAPLSSCTKGTWLLGLPVAMMPLWQVAQLPGVTVTELCSVVLAKLTVDLWQLSQDGHEVVGIWLLVLPIAVVPLWHVAQLPGTTPV